LPLVSVITPSLDQAPFLEDALRSVAEQDYERIEHIVVDGGSRDGSVEILRRWAGSHPITWSSEPDKGQADAIRIGVERSAGDIVCWLNSDDTYLDERVVSDVVDAFAGGAQIVTGAGWYIDERGRRLRRIPFYPDRLSHETLVHTDWLLQPATFVRRSLFLSCPLDVGLRYAFDWDFFICITAKSSPLVLDRDIAGYRRHPTSKTLVGGTRRQAELLEVVRRHQGRRSTAYQVLRTFVAAHRLADRLPSRLGATFSHVLARLAYATGRLTNGRGIPS
jgi:glycosyltransferase involved in cell wall biosynthesis